MLTQSNKSRECPALASVPFICRDLSEALDQKQAADSSAVQGIIRRHHIWLKQFWTPTRASYAGHAELIVESDLRKAYEAHHPKLPEFLAAGIKSYAKRL